MLILYCYLFLAIFVNLAIETKLYVDANKAGFEALGARQKLVKFYNQIPTAEQIDEVEKSDFKELKQRFRNQRSAKTDDNNALMQECFVSHGPLPKKIRAAPAVAAEGVQNAAGGAEGQTAEVNG